MKQLKQALFLGLMVILSATASAKTQYQFWSRSDEGFYTFVYEDYKNSRFSVATHTAWNDRDDQKRYWHISNVKCISETPHPELTVDGMLLNESGSYRLIPYKKWVVKNPMFSRELDPDLKGAYEEFCTKKRYFYPMPETHRNFM